MTLAAWKVSLVGRGDEEKKWKLWTEGVRKYGNSVLSIDDDLIILSKQNDNSIILKAKIDGVFQPL